MSWPLADTAGSEPRESVMTSQDALRAFIRIVYNRRDPETGRLVAGWRADRYIVPGTGTSGVDGVDQLLESIRHGER